ncbi:MAG: 6-carboxytetrahydropterin synthase [Bryobacteraceae bacterium]|nr:6-carboxytetrahydropterin synthase [Bryobacteraceae bacterium]
MRLTRVYRFCASHRLHAPELSEAENAEMYGKCNNPYGHGHDYVLHVSVSGEPDAGTGRIVNPALLDRYVQERVLRIFDHRDMNQDVPDFEGVPTTENLAYDVARRLRANWEGTFGRAAALDRVFVQETPRNTFELRMRG